jgi:lipopolysaccharide/colanic/teichoic acid biosynthesis glycosyltransferase
MGKGFSDAGEAAPTPPISHDRGWEEECPRRFPNDCSKSSGVRDMTITIILVTLLVSIFGRIMAEEVKAWFGWVHKTLRRKAVDRLPVACRDRYDEEWASAIEEIPGDLFKLIHSIGLLRASVGIRQVCGADVVRSSETFIVLKSELSIVFRRALDIVFSILVLSALGPLLLAIAILIKIDSPGPVFYYSERIGRMGHVFGCIKFRTMVCDAEEKQFEIYKRKGRDGATFNFTRIGGFLRKYGLYELPQLFNVLRGEMSVVGRRPPLASYVEEYKIDLPHLDSTPGLIGFWDVSVDEFYSRNRGIWFDLKIILQTILFVFRNRG